MHMIRKHKREPTFAVCSLIIDNQITRALMTDFSHMGAGIKTKCQLSPKKYISILYRNEKNEVIRMLTYVVHSSKRNNYYVSGLQFVGLEDRSASA